MRRPDKAGHLADELGASYMACAPATFGAICDAFRSEDIELFPVEVQEQGSGVAYHADNQSQRNKVMIEPERRNHAGCHKHYKDCHRQGKRCQAVHPVAQAASVGQRPPIYAPSWKKYLEQRLKGHPAEYNGEVAPAGFEGKRGEPPCIGIHRPEKDAAVV